MWTTYFEFEVTWSSTCWNSVSKHEINSRSLSEREIGCPETISPLSSRVNFSRSLETLSMRGSWRSMTSFNATPVHESFALLDCGLLPVVVTVCRRLFLWYGVAYLCLCTQLGVRNNYESAADSVAADDVCPVCAGEDWVAPWLPMLAHWFPDWLWLTFCKIWGRVCQRRSTIPWTSLSERSTP